MNQTYIDLSAGSRHTIPMHICSQTFMTLSLDSEEGWSVSYADKIFDQTMFRRICPGLYLADQTAFTFAAAIVQAYDIMPLAGDKLPKEFIYQDAVIRYASGFSHRVPLLTFVQSTRRNEVPLPTPN